MLADVQFTWSHTVIFISTVVNLVATHPSFPLGGLSLPCQYLLPDANVLLASALSEFGPQILLLLFG